MLFPLVPFSVRSAKYGLRNNDEFMGLSIIEIIAAIVTAIILFISFAFWNFGMIRLRIIVICLLAIGISEFVQTILVSQKGWLDKE